MIQESHFWQQRIKQLTSSQSTARPLSYSDWTINYLSKNKFQLELTPVGQHRRNKAERAIRTYKNHFIATLAGVDKECPVELWPDFMEQIGLTINLFRSASAGLFIKKQNSS